MSKKNIIIIAAVGVLVLALVGGGFFMMWKKLSTIDKIKEEVTAAAAPKVEQPPSIGPLFALESFIVNLADPGGKRYLRVTMNLELRDGKVNEAITQRLPQVRDCILMVLPTRKVDDLQSIEGKNALREELITKLNQLLGAGSVTKIYFTEFVIQ
ncbi:flagellar basal body-associated FliL family protein [Desulfatirhabdium butyrativorans]|uniref:flagellar basal body-associated FliL family protein n=1 Tax=Desulfatirhabdium butyrativorans TaxID=340467 RepID=UPI0003FDDA1E|nr:flagellar basal body-associated FliL family protein [Desulfatirhabdium butyrativorans]